MGAQLVNTAVLIGAGYFSSSICQKLKIPAARLVGPILFVAFLKILGLNINSPNALTLICSTILGVFIGLKINKQTIDQIKGVLRPGLLLVIWNILITCVYGYLLVHISPLDNSTAFLSVIPGGIAEVSVLALSYHADLAQITSFQMARILTIVMIIPMLVTKYLGQEDKASISHMENPSDVRLSKEKTSYKNWWHLFVIGIIGSTIFTLVHFPAGRMIGALVFIAFYNLFLAEKIVLPPGNIYNFAQIGMGSIIGASVTQESASSIGDLIFIILLITFLVVFNSLIISWIFSKVFKWNFVTAFLGIIPGGLAPMVLIADEVNADPVIVGSLQLLRLLTAIIAIPIVYGLIL